jgi:glutamate-ammonia-ligase adenylyltransferase
MPSRPAPHPHASSPAATALIEDITRHAPALAADPDMRCFLALAATHSPFLADLARRHAARLAEAVRDGADEVLARLIAETQNLPFPLSRDALGARLRVLRGEVALIAAWGEIAGTLGLEASAARLADFAEAAIGAAVRHLLREAHERGRIRLPYPDVPERDSGFAVLGMGKLGGRELNFSSDVDLVLIHDPARHPGREETLTATFAQLARDLIALLQTRTTEGYVFRVDLRLRPDPAATPPSVSLEAALTYYESLAQSWERAAMLKARPIAGDPRLGASFLAAIRPFVWRRSVDFSLINDIAAMRQKMESASRRNADPLTAALGFDLKRGEGGIREIEFLVQTLELIWGGKDPELRVRGTLPALRALAVRRKLGAEEAETLAEAYRFLRLAEHRLQMQADRQTHRLPGSAEALAAYADFLGFSQLEAFLARLSRERLAVRGIFERLFARLPVEEAARPAGLDFSGPETPAETAAQLTALGFADAEAVAETVRGWLAGRVGAFRSARARDLLGPLLPALLAAIGRGRDPARLLQSWERMFAGTAAGTPLLSLFAHHPDLIGRLCELFEATPVLGDYLARMPRAIEALLEPPLGPPPARLLGARLKGVSDAELVLETIRDVVREENFRLSAALIEGRIGPDRAAARRTALADAVLRTLLSRVRRWHERRFGTLPGVRLALVLLGKGGSRELMAGSDLDLMILYDVPAEVEQSEPRRGARRVAASEWCLRFAHALIAALTTHGIDGPLYAVDMRLRPSGSKGPVAVSLAAFRRYHQEAAWTWEHMALTRARVVAATAGFGPVVRAAIGEALAAARARRSVDEIRRDAREMRARLAAEHPPRGPWDVKYRAGGAMDLVFTVQVLLLLAAPHHPEVLVPETHRAIPRLARAGYLTAAEARRLAAAERFFRLAEEVRRLTGERDATISSEVLARVLCADRVVEYRAVEYRTVECRVVECRAGGSPGAARARLEQHAASVAEAFARHVGGESPSGDMVPAAAEEGGSENGAQGR